MSIKIIVSDKLKFKVKGTIKDEEGRDQPFDFTLTCNRLNQDQINAKLGPMGDDPSVLDFMLQVIEDWQGVRDEENKPMPYTEDNYRGLCKIPGMSVVVYRTYLAEVGAKEKN